MRIVMGVLFALFFTASQAAEIFVRTELNGSRPIVISGEIRKGDAEKFRRVVVERRGRSIKIDSAGGDVLEAMKIGEMIYALRGSVRVDKGGVCASACFFIWLNGANRMASPREQVDAVFGVVGLHRPFLRNPDGSNESLNMQVQVMRVVSEYLKSKLIPQKYIDLMMSKSSADIYWLSQDDLKGIGSVPPELIELYLARCGATYDALFDQKFEAERRGDFARVRVVEEKEKALEDCEFELNFSPFRATLQKMSSGWIPEIR